MKPTNKFVLAFFIGIIIVFMGLLYGCTSKEESLVNKNITILEKYDNMNITEVKESVIDAAWSDFQIESQLVIMSPDFNHDYIKEFGIIDMWYIKLLNKKRNSEKSKKLLKEIIQ
jgi:hypothetical protein